MKLTVIFLLFLAIFTACQNKTNKTIFYQKIAGNKVLVCDIDKITETREMKLSELVESAEFIRLEKKTDALVGNTWLREISDEHIFLADIQNNLMLFSPNGKFIKSWKPGRGPFEFVLPAEPQIVGDKVYVKDKIGDKFLKYSINNQPSRSIELAKKSGIAHVLGTTNVLSMGNSTSKEDPYLVCLQDFEGKVLQSVSATLQVNLTPPVVGEAAVAYPFKKDWHIHFPTNDTLKNYNISENRLTPIAVFYSKSHIENNTNFYAERETKGLNIQDPELTKTVLVVPEYETKKYYFLSIYRYGEKKDLPWYFASRSTCLINKETNEAFHVKLINDFWGDIPFSFQGNSQRWSENFIQDFPAIQIKEKFTRLLEKKGDELDEAMKQKIEQFIAETNEDDNNIIFRYKLK